MIDVKSLTKEQKKEVLKELYISDGNLVKEVLNDLSQKSKSSDLEISESDKRRLDEIINLHFEQYDEVFKALA